MYNPYLDLLRLVGQEDLSIRSLLVKSFSWAIPNDEAIRCCVQQSPILEIGAGTGYWAHLVQKAGGKIIPTDKEVDKGHWLPIREFDHTIAANEESNYYTLMLCWPPYSSTMAYEAVSKWKGNTLIYIGEWKGCCASGQFFDYLDKYFTLKQQINIPCWYDFNDSFYLLERRP
jgi:hypothetical protein